MNAMLETQLIGEIYDAALSPNLWRGILVKIRDAMEIDECTIFFYDAQCRARNYADCASGDEDLIKLFLSDHIDSEVAILHEYFRHLPCGLILEAPVLEQVANKRYENYFEEDYRNDLLKTLEVRGGVMMIKGKIISATMGFKSFNNAPPVGQHAIQFAQRLAPHVVQAMRIHNHITSLQTTYTSLYAVLNSVRFGVFLLGKSGEVLFSNDEAAQLLVNSSGLVLGKSGVLQHSQVEANAIFTETIQSLLENPQESNPLTLNFTLPHSLSALPFNISALPIHHEHAQHFATSGASLALFVKDPNKPLSIPALYLQQAYQLTEAEISVAQHLLNSLDTHEVAKARNTSLETTRSHIKQLLQKTHTNSQTELISLLTCLSNEI